METNTIFKNISVPEIIVGMESKFYNLLNRYNNTGNLSITLYNFNESFKNGFFYKTIYGNSEYIVPASILKLFAINFFLNIIESHNLYEKNIIVGNEVNKQYLNKHLFRVGIKKGQFYKIKELVELSLIASSSDSVYTLSRAVYNIYNNKDYNSDWIESKDDWIEMIKFICEKIKDYYYESTLNIDLSILDPTGIKGELISTEDIAKLISFLITSKSKILDIVSKDKMSINSRVYNSTNAFVRKDKPYFYHPKIIGLKTGSLDGWKNLLLLYKLKPINYIAILVAGCENHSDTKEIANLLIKELDNKLFNISF